MGDDIPPGELNRQTSKGQHFGFPWYGGGDVRTNEYADSEPPADVVFPAVAMQAHAARSEEHTSELQSLMRISYAVFCLKKKKKTKIQRRQHTRQTKKLTQQQRSHSKQQQIRDNQT